MKKYYLAYDAVADEFFQHYSDPSPSYLTARDQPILGLPIEPATGSLERQERAKKLLNSWVPDGVFLPVNTTHTLDVLKTLTQLNTKR